MPAEPETEPKTVRRYAQDAAQATGADPVVQRLTTRSWRVAIEGEHVMAEAIFEARPGGPLKWVRGTLTIDGKHRPPQSWDELRKTWNQYERTRPPQPGTGKENGLAVIPPAPRGRQIPPAVRQARGLLTARFGEEAVRTGYTAGRWIVGSGLPGGDGIRLFFIRNGHSWHMDPVTPMQLVAGDKDITESVTGNIDEALAKLEHTSPDTSAGPAPAGKPAPSARDHGIEVRNMVVHRELPASSPNLRRA